MNRKQRRELGRKMAAGDPGLTVENPNAGGIDVGNESRFVAALPGRDMAEAAWHSGGSGERSAHQNVSGRKTDVQECRG